jgi:outer membrane lipoprotein-sorting protein
VPVKAYQRFLGAAICALMLGGALSLALPGGAAAGEVGLVDGLWVMKKVDERYEGDDVQEDLKLELWSTRGRGELSRTMDVRWMKKQFGRDDRLVIHFLAPSTAAGVTLLTFITPYADDERWLYFPAGPVIRRVRASDEHSNFMGTDFTYYDLSEREPDEENHKLLRIEKFQGADCYVVESTPKGRVGAGYSRKQTWVDSQRFIKLKIEYFHANGSAWKQYDTEAWREIDGVWTPLKVVMEDRIRGHKTIIERANVRYNQKVSADFFQPKFVDCVIYKDGKFALIPFEQRPTRVLAGENVLPAGARKVVAPPPPPVQKN